MKEAPRFAFDMIDPETTLEEVWDDASAELASAMPKDYTTEELGRIFDALHDDLLDGSSQLLQVIDTQSGAVAAWLYCRTGIEANGKRGFSVHLLAGKGVDEWIEPLLDCLESFIQYLEYDYFNVHGRLGWKKFIQRRGFEHNFTVFTKVMEMSENG